MFNVQSILVFVIIAATAFIIIRHLCKQAKGKRSSCNCGCCGNCRDHRHCDTTQR
ncbi:MAG: FeoB-associated Cys-rich membrane protein [Bacteroidaceae bacterium]|nr:FeoB-associated Cys-rich membrane protein [Bacteroidaceae bacterium]